MNRHEKRAAAATARRGHLGHWTDCGCEHLGLFACVGVCIACGDQGETAYVLPTSALPGESRMVGWGPCGSCVDGEYVGTAICQEVRPL